RRVARDAAPRGPLSPGARAGPAPDGRGGRRAAPSRPGRQAPRQHADALLARPPRARTHQPGVRMLDTIRTAEGAFTADVAGPIGAPLVLLLHGFPQSRHSWRHQVPVLASAGYRAVAPDQRGYSPGVRPDPADGLAAYGIDRLVGDVLDL